jgi:transposase
MTERIYAKKIKGNVYYYLQRTWREKVDPQDQGKTRGSGKSRVRTQSIYLGTAASIWKRLNETRSAVELRHRHFGFVAAICQTAKEIGLLELLQEHLPGERYGIGYWLYFFLPIVNRLQYATSKQRMGKWAQTTILPDLLGFDPTILNSKTFWYATDDIISEKELRQRRAKAADLKEDLFVGIDDTIFRTIEEQLFARLKEKFNLSSEAILYDTTNFFTYIEEPVRSHLAQTGHNKECHHHLKQVGLAMCVEKEWGIPLFHRVYRGNSQDSNTFAGIVEELIFSMRAGFGEIENLVLVLDKGNNSQENFTALAGKLQWVGSLVLTHYPELIDLPLSSYPGQWEDFQYYRCEKEVMGIRCALVLTYHEKLAQKQEHSLQNNMDKLQKKVQEKWNSYKRRPKKVSAGVLRIIKESRYGKYLCVRYRKGELVFSQTDAVAEKRKRFGKHLLFSSEVEAENGWIINQYHSKNQVEEDFKLLKDPELIRWRPARHWTDTKIRAFGFCCVMALVLIRVMQLKAVQGGLRMSAAVLKEELTDLKEVTLIYDDQSAQTMISNRSSVQKRLWEIFNLGILERQLTRH